MFARSLASLPVKRKSSLLALTNKAQVNHAPNATRNPASKNPSPGHPQPVSSYEIISTQFAVGSIKQAGDHRVAGSRLANDPAYFISGLQKAARRLVEHGGGLSPRVVCNHAGWQGQIEWRKSFIGSVDQIKKRAICFQPQNKIREEGDSASKTLVFVCRSYRL